MKLIYTTILVLIGAVSFGQSVSQTSDQLNVELQVQELDHQASQLEKEVSKSKRSIESKEKEVNDTERKLSFNATAQQETAQKKDEVKASMNGLVLQTLNDKIHQLEKENSKNSRGLDHNHRAINKKKALIEKLTLEIERMEAENEVLEEEVATNKEEVKDTQDVITNNDLVVKVEKHNQLVKEEKKLKREEVKLLQKEGKAKETIARENRAMSEKELELELLAQRKKRLSQPNRLGSITQ